MRVLSLFDGISCGQVALNELGVDVQTYYACEIDSTAIEVTLRNFPSTVQLGNITQWRDWEIDWSKIDLLLAGFPCQAWSFAGKGLGLSDERGLLAKTLLEVKEKLIRSNPEAKFLFENTLMKREHQEMLSGWFGVLPHKINSKLVVPQNRERLYWYNWGNSHVKDKGTSLKDIGIKRLGCGRVVGRRLCPETGRRKDADKSIKAIQRFELRGDGRSGCITTVNKDNVLGDSSGKVRDFTKSELESLQSLPLGYLGEVSRNQAQKLIGNSWTVDIIKCILGGVVTKEGDK